MKLLIILCTILFQNSTSAEILADEVYSIEEGIIKFKNGRVAFISKNQFELKSGDYVEATLDDTFELKSLKEIRKSSKPHLSKSINNEDPPIFEPTIVPDINEAMAIFNRSNPHYRRQSECTDLAHIWAHDEFKRSATKSRKAFVFFTASYINSVRFKWWFHVAPMYSVNINGAVESFVMDYRYFDRPVSVKEWTDQFVYTKRDCKVTTKFSEYDINPQTENCYLIFESMHYKIPQELSNQETLRQFKTITTESELKLALSLGFKH